MEQELFFTERQKFKQWWLWLIMLGADVQLLYNIFTHLIDQRRSGNNLISDSGLLIATGLVILLTFFVFYSRLDTQIKKDGIYVKFFPLHLTFKYYAWDKITKIFVRQYNPIAEYGGWGIRFSLFGKGTAFNISGDKGLQLELSNNKKLLIGTQKPDELTQALNKVAQLTNWHIHIF